MTLRSILAAVAARPAAWLRGRHRAAGDPGSVCYFPPFDSTEELTSHYHRALWYLPAAGGRCSRVWLFSLCGDPGPRPDFMCDDVQPSRHVEVRAGGLWTNLRALWRSRLILVWKKSAASRLLLGARRLGFPVVDVDTHDPAAVEYGAYCSLMWKHLLAGRDRHAVRQANAQRFRDLAERIRACHPARACVFGTGPTLEEARDFDFSGCLTIACNSIVQNRELLDHLEPEFITAGDVVSHFGVSAYAAEFRRDLLRTLNERDTTFVATDAFAYLLTLNHPEIADRVVLVPQTHDGPSYDLVAHFSAPKLDSVLNILMLPLAATFCDEIFLLGCDGKVPKRDNEDFWAHASGAQYHDLVDTGHRCHPTFDVNRQRTTHDRYNRSIEETIGLGEREHGKSYASLRQSHTPVLSERTAGADQLRRFRRKRPRTNADQR